MNNIEKQLEFARQSLLDFTMRNKLLNFRTSKARTIKVIDEIPSEIYNFLVLQQKKMEFLPTKKKKTSIEEEVVNTEILDQKEKEISKIWELPPPDFEASKNHIDRFL
ncbi:MAG: DUF4011 domain-containing protein [ANME-2 cluster archaeon]|nr:DUF4011 domain-containing protein [ANME-2 cluster archaeon]